MDCIHNQKHDGLTGLQLTWVVNSLHTDLFPSRSITYRKYGLTAPCRHTSGCVEARPFPSNLDRVMSRSRHRGHLMRNTLANRSEAYEKRFWLNLERGLRSALACPAGHTLARKDVRRRVNENQGGGPRERETMTSGNVRV